MSYAQHATVGHCAIDLGRWGATNPQHFYGRILVEVQEGSSPGTSKNLHLMRLTSGHNTDQKYMDGYIFFMWIAVQSHRKIP